MSKSQELKPQQYSICNRLVNIPEKELRVGQIIRIRIIFTYLIAFFFKKNLHILEVFDTVVFRNSGSYVDSDPIPLRVLAMSN